MSRDCEKNYRELVDKLGVILNLPTVKESGMISVEDIRKLVPELKEDEGEIIKKELIAAFQNGVAYNSISKERAKDYISWIEKHKQTPQWMIDFLNEHRSHFGVLMDYDEHREVEGKLLCIKQWLEGNFVEQKIQPKFEVGDTIIHVDDGADIIYKEHKVTNVLDLGYILDNGHSIEIADQDDWLVVRRGSVDEAMAEVEEKSKAFTEAHKGEDSEKILADMRGEEPISNELDTAAKESSRIERSDDTEVGYDLSRYNGFVEGALWKEQQIKKNAVVAECSTLLYANGDEVRYAVQYPKDKRPVERGDKVKIFLIKE